jgi:hypothetical protein
MTAKTLPVDQYYTQTDSASGQAYRMCFSSTCAMALKFIRPDALIGYNADDVYLKRVNMYGDTTYADSQVRALHFYKVDGAFRVNGTKADIIREIDAGYPVAVGILHHGSVAYPSGGGHWMLAIGYDDTHIICHDPYGEADMVNGGYTKVGPYGKAIKYTWKNWLKRWQPEGPGHGYMLTFREAIP